MSFKLHFIIVLQIFMDSLVSSISTTSLNQPQYPNIPYEQLNCRPTGLIQDTSCHYETIDELNKKLRLELSSAVRLPIFRYHKVDLYRQCPFWSENGLCGNQACAVNELDQNDIPAYWRTSDLSDLKTTDAKLIPIDLKNKCVVKEQDYCVLDDINDSQSTAVYVDLLANPERFTGYSGASAQRVWRAIYEENCFDSPPRHSLTPLGLPPPSAYAGLKTKPPQAQENQNVREETCLEKRVYHKLLSGLHTSISMHICDEYLDPKTGNWTPNLQCYLNRVGRYPERLKNLYFAHTLMLRALSRAASYLSSHRVELCTGDPKADDLTRKTLNRLIAIAHAHPVTFDETSMFKGSSSNHKSLKEEFKQHFRNVSRIMDCVGCDKCRLWGKLQITGLGTALKLLFEYEESDTIHSDFHLTRAELIAFINTLNRLSESLEAVEKFRKLWEQRSNEGTLPVQLTDEKLDASASGKAAQAISLSPGFSSRSHTLREDAKHARVVKSSDNHRSETHHKIVKPSEKSVNSSAPVSAQPITTAIQSTPTALVYSQTSNNRSNSAIKNRVKQQAVLDLSSFTRSTARFFKLVTQGCKHSVVVCAHWFDGLFGHFKTLVSVSRLNHQDQTSLDGHIKQKRKREKEL
ncbi:hypothetical protein O181_037007 [Austropuccinia psidii MF-1]|uniref:Endoplasmic oxidoreductin-1 n=1 Tax=Austropuccinia psidii MF-1 TaxID=1389203 RepID=A0A9Q3HAG7_9BASI|nr:hypothetical protein [Austropuccinia psidii MF-1]